MLRQSLIYLLLSVLIVVFSRYAHLLIVYIDLFFTYVNLKLTPIFSQTGWGLIIRKVLVLMLMPIIITGIPALLYRVIKGREMPHFIAIVWVIWTIIVLSVILIR
ncbi:hypothetical protein [Legionella quateirensis]|uniref:Uncharacterized protein n=1 Tax=Legionella quateirensis TaxID=45072 RepID=A0A378L0A3_9GAMM|nr:hypothetical protein [Legionella quateirensis]KTD51235.1 hypothetical protein Lqua_1462 [Legionella quateirensis]STY17520.1 Uncharacterised protein [Legionella quateirensis]